MSKFIKTDSKATECCDNTTMFLLDNGKTQFALNIEIVLQCMKFAEEQGKIPALPTEWWMLVSRNFNNV